MKRRKKFLRTRFIFIAFLFIIFISGVATFLSEKTARLTVVATGYSSTPGQTDSTPRITASGDEVFDGLVAANFLEFGTKIIIPGVFGSKVFTVKDRMNKRFTNKDPGHIDIWFPNEEGAKNFGAQAANIIVFKPLFAP
ncbi:MAG: hypothetical protein AAB847_00825 [Patescibacteria group bacterium]